MASTNYGKDISCTDSLKSGRFASGVRLVGEACYRRLTTPRGSLRGGEEEANYGLDLAELVGKGRPDLIAASLPGRIKSELLKDERVETVDVEVVTTTSGPDTSFEITIDVVTGEGPFELQIAVSAVTVSLLGIE